MSRMNANIILAGQQPDFVNTLARSNQAAAFANQSQHQNALRQAYQQHGPGILAGDPNALNQLSRLDPGQAFKVQQTNRQNERQDRMDALTEQEFAFRLQQFKANASAAEVKAQAEEFKRTVFSASGAKNPEEWDAIVTQAGESELVGQFDNREALLRKYMTAAQILEADAPQKPQSVPGKLKADLDAGLITPEQFEAEMAADGFVLETDGKGGVTFKKGKLGNKKLPKTTEGEKSAAGYLSRMQAAEVELDGLSVEEPAVRSITSLLVGGSDFEGLVLSERQQRILQAQRDWVRAKLRKESGAVIGADEMAEEVRTYFPLPGEGPEVIEQKRRARKEAERQFEIMSGNAAPQAERQDKQESRIPDFKAMTDEELDAWIAENGGEQ